MNDPLKAVFFAAVFAIAVVVCLLLFPKKKKSRESANSDYYDVKNAPWEMLTQFLVMLLTCIVIGVVFFQNDIPAWPAVVIFVASQIFAVMCRKMANHKGYNERNALWAGAILGIVGLLYYAGLPYSSKYVDQTATMFAERIANTLRENGHAFAIRDDYDI